MIPAHSTRCLEFTVFTRHDFTAYEPSSSLQQGMTSQHGTTSPVYTSHCQYIHPTDDAKCDMDKNTLLLSVHNLLDSLMYMYDKYWQCAVHKMKQKHSVSHNNNTIIHIIFTHYSILIQNLSIVTVILNTSVT